jgi:serine O-acetyltransferase
MQAIIKKRIEETIAVEMTRLVGAGSVSALRDQPAQWEALVSRIVEDLYAYEQRDPASRCKPLLILQEYPTFRAVLLYRVAHAALGAPGLGGSRGRDIAQRLTAAARLDTGIEIHPNARIGARFVIDHGWGTVVGETAIIGDDCYVLGGVTLGAVGISNNVDGKRHPTIGDRVQIGGNARILGDVTVGSDCFIGSYTLITADVAPKSRVLIVNQLQIVHGDHGAAEGMTIHGVVRLGQKLVMQATGIVQPVAWIVSTDGIPLLSLITRHHDDDPQVFILEFPPSALDRLLHQREQLDLCIEDRGRKALIIDLHRLFRCYNFGSNRAPRQEPERLEPSFV